MRKYLKIPAFVIAIAIIIITLSAGGSKELRDVGGGRSLIEELYQQAVKQNNELKSIQDGMERFQRTKRDALDRYNNFIAYNGDYYGEAKDKASRIIDVATKQKATELVTKSEAAYQAKIKDWQATIATMQANEKELYDLHALLQLMITEPMMQRYQNAGLPDQTKAKEVNDEIRYVIDKIKAITK